MGASNQPLTAQSAAQQAAWDRLWEILLQPPSAGDQADAPQSEREG
jgi:hypothetical protein